VDNALTYVAGGNGMVPVFFPTSQALRLAGPKKKQKNRGKIQSSGLDVQYQSLLASTAYRREGRSAEHFSPATGGRRRHRSCASNSANNQLVMSECVPEVFPAGGAPASGLECYLGGSIEPATRETGTPLHWCPTIDCGSLSSLAFAPGSGG